MGVSVCIHEDFQRLRRFRKGESLELNMVEAFFMAHSNRGIELLSIPLTPGGAVTFSGVIS